LITYNIRGEEVKRYTLDEADKIYQERKCREEIDRIGKEHSIAVWGIIIQAFDRLNIRRCANCNNFIPDGDDTIMGKCKAFPGIRTDAFNQDAPYSCFNIVTPKMRKIKINIDAICAVPICAGGEIILSAREQEQIRKELEGKAGV